MSGAENPPAFPRDERYLGHNGMTLRDWFAGLSVLGMMAAEAHDTIYDLDQVAGRAFRLADAMLFARQTGGEA